MSNVLPYKYRYNTYIAKTIRKKNCSVTTYRKLIEHTKDIGTITCIL